jgi:hypothetical protein
VAVLASHVLTGLWLAIGDPAFARTLGEEKRRANVFWTPAGANNG